MEMRATWLYFLGTDKNKAEQFVYGLSLPTICPKEYSLKPVKKATLPSGKKFFEFRCVAKVELEDFSNAIDLDNFYTNKKELPKTILDIIAKNMYIQSYKCDGIQEEIESPISSLTNVTSYYTDYILNFDLNGNDSYKLLVEIGKATNQSFNGMYSNRIGCFEIVTTQPWANDKNPFRIESNRENDKYYFIKDESFKEEVTVVFKAYHSISEKSFEKLFIIPETMKNYEIDFSPENVCLFKYSIYSKTGDLIDKNRHIYINQCIVNFEMPGVTTHLNDDYSRRDSSLTKVSHLEKTSSTVFSKNKGSLALLKKHYQNIYSSIQENTVSNNMGIWISKSNDKLGDAVLYLKKCCQNATEVVIIDPYADTEVIDLANRLDVNQVTVISSNKSIPSLDLEGVKKRILDRKSIFKNSVTISDKTNYYFINKDFHDRFIYVKNMDSSEKIYCIPNSINAVLKNDDFLILKLTGSMKKKAADHILNLRNKCTVDTQLSEEEDSTVVKEDDILRLLSFKNKPETVDSTFLQKQLDKLTNKKFNFINTTKLLSLFASMNPYEDVYETSYMSCTEYILENLNFIYVELESLPCLISYSLASYEQSIHDLFIMPISSELIAKVAYLDRFLPQKKITLWGIIYLYSILLNRDLACFEKWISTTERTDLKLLFLHMLASHIASDSIKVEKLESSRLPFIQAFYALCTYLIDMPHSRICQTRYECNDIKPLFSSKLPKDSLIIIYFVYMCNRYRSKTVEELQKNDEFLANTIEISDTHINNLNSLILENSCCEAIYFLLVKQANIKKECKTELFNKIAQNVKRDFLERKMCPVNNFEKISLLSKIYVEIGTCKCLLHEFNNEYLDISFPYSFCKNSKWHDKATYCLNLGVTLLESGMLIPKEKEETVENIKFIFKEKHYIFYNDMKKLLKKYNVDL